MHISIANISQMVTDRANIAIANKYKVAIRPFLILSEMQRIAFSPIAFVEVCVRMSAYVCVCVHVCVFIRLNASLLDRTKLFEVNLPLFHRHVGH